MKTRVSFFPLALALALLLLSGARAAVRQAERPGQGAAAQIAAAGKYYALVIGNNDYKHMPRLKTAESDAAAVAAALRDGYGFETRLLLNAGRQKIIAALGEYRRKLEPDDSLLIYYAGHGHRDRDADNAYWLPVDASKEEVSNWISADDITSGVRAIPARHVLIISDSCYSGALYRDLSPSLSTPFVRRRFLEKMAAGKSRTLMASGGNEPVLDAGGGAYSVFASALLTGLQQMEDDAFTADELFHSYVQESVAGRSRQTPEYSPLRNSGHDAGDFVFIRRSGAAPAAPAAPALPTNPRAVADGTPPRNSGDVRPSLSEAPSRDEEMIFSDGLSLYRQKQYASAAALFVSFLEKFPNSIITDLVLLWLGRSYIELGRLEDARQVGQRLRSIKDTPFVELFGRELDAASGRRVAGANRPTTALRRKRLSPLVARDTPGGSAVKITSDGELGDYSAYRSGDRFIVVIPRAEALAAAQAPALRGLGFEGVEVARRGEDVVYTFKLARGASARPFQKFNQLIVQFTARREGER